MKKTVSFLLIAALVISLVPFSAVAGGIVLTGIESISYTPADENAYVYYENTNGDWQKDGQNNDYFNYRINFNENDVLTVNYSNDTVKQYVAVFNNGIEFVSADNEVLKSWDDVGIFNDQYNEHWYSGGTYTFYVEYLGYKAPVTASVINNPVVSISYQPRTEVVEYFEYGGNFDTDNDNNTYYRYNVISINTGDRLTVTYNDDRGTVEYICEFNPDPCFVNADRSDVIYSRDIEMYDEQWHKHFTLGAENFYYVTYMGKTCAVPITIVNNPISSFVYTPANEIEIIEHIGGRWVDKNGVQFYEYDIPWFKPGDELAITYSDTGVTDVYTYLNGNDPVTDIYYNGFYKGDEYLPYSETLSMSAVDHENWGKDKDNYLNVIYRDNTSNDVKVNIIENPVKAIRYECCDDVVIVENTNMYYDAWDDRYYYNVPYCQPGDKLIVTDNNDNEIVYVYNMDEYGMGTFVSEGHPDIPSDKVEFHTNQWETPWTIGDNQYTAEYSGREFTLTATIIENPVAAIEYEQKEKYEVFENTNGHFDSGTGIFEYNYNWADVGDKLTVIDKNGKRTVYECKIVNEEFWEMAFVSDNNETIDVSEVRFDSDQNEHPWHIGDDNPYFVTYMGASFTLYATVKDNPVAAIRFEPKNMPEAMVGVRCYYEDYLGYDVYDAPDFSAGDRLIIIADKDNNETVFTAEYDEHHDIVFVSGDGDVIDGYDIMTDINSQYDTPWTVGEDNEYVVSFMGAECVVKCRLIDNPVKSISFTQDPVPYYLEGTNMYYEPFAECDFYERPRINEGDVLTVVYKDTEIGTVEYVAKRDLESGDLVFESQNGDVLFEDYRFEYFDNQWETPWTVGTNYWTFSFCGKAAKVPVIIEENNITGISYKSASTPKVWAADYEMDTDPETGIEYKHYNIPELQDGDILTVYYSDKPSEDYVLTFDENDGERYFVNGDTRFDCHILVPFDKQNETEWQLGDGNYYYIDLYGNAAPIEVEVIDNDVESVTFNTQAPIVIDEYTGGSFEYNHLGKIYVYDYQSIIPLGASITVKYINGAEVEYFFSVDEENRPHLVANDLSELDIYELNTVDNQWDEPWKIGENYFAIAYHGVRTEDIVVTVNHTPGEWVIVKRPTFEDEGLKQKICTACGEVIESEVIPAVKSTDPRIEVESVTGVVGKTVDVKVMFKNNPGIASAKLNISFPDELTLMNVTYGNLGENVMTPETFESPVTLNWYSNLVNLTTPDFTFATLTFAVAENAALGDCRITVDYDYDDIFNIDEANIDFAVIDGIVTINDHLPGDINGDGKVNNKDIVRLFKYLSDWDVEVDSKALDVNGDGAVNNKDLLRLFKYLSNWDVKIY